MDTPTGFTVSEGAPDIPDGVYPVRLDAIEVRDGTDRQTGTPTKYLRWSFTVKLDADVYEELSALTSLKLSPKSNAYGFVKALLGRDLQKGEGLEFVDLHGKQAMATIANEARDGQTEAWPRIKALAPVRQQAKPRPEPKPEPEPAAASAGLPF